MKKIKKIMKLKMKIRWRRN